MPVFKVWNVLRTIKKFVVANTLEELISKGKKKLGLDCGEECYVFDLTDGTEVDDDECFSTFEKGSIFILGKQWNTPSETKILHDTPVEDRRKRVSCTDEDKSTEFDQSGEFDSFPEFDQSGEFDSFPEFDLPAEVDPSLHVEETEAIYSEKAVKVDIKGNKRQFSTETKENAKKRRVSEKFENNREQTHPESSDGEEEPQFSEEQCDLLEDNQSAQPSTSSLLQKEKTMADVLMQGPYQQAKMRNIKIYSDKEIESPATQLEKTRRKFWNEKAEQLASKPKTSSLNKTTVAGIIDVSWTLRKTSLIEDDARNVNNQEKVLFSKEDLNPKMGSQKKETLPKNLERMAKAHFAVENTDKELQECREKSDKAKSKHERALLTREYNKKKNIMDGAYTELKRAQDATVKSLKVKKQQLESRLKSKSIDSEAEQPTTSGEGALHS